MHRVLEINSSSVPISSACLSKTTEKTWNLNTLISTQHQRGQFTLEERNTSDFLGILVFWLIDLASPAM